MFELDRTLKLMVAKEQSQAVTNRVMYEAIMVFHDVTRRIVEGSGPIIIAESLFDWFGPHLVPGSGFANKQVILSSGEFMDIMLDHFNEAIIRQLTGPYRNLYRFFGEFSGDRLGHFAWEVEFVDPLVLDCEVRPNAKSGSLYYEEWSLLKKGEQN